MDRTACTESQCLYNGALYFKRRIVKVLLRVVDRKPEILKLGSKMKRLFVQNWVGMCLVRQRLARDWKDMSNDKNWV